MAILNQVSVFEKVTYKDNPYPKPLPPDQWQSTADKSNNLNSRSTYKHNLVDSNKLYAPLQRNLPIWR